MINTAIRIETDKLSNDLDKYLTAGELFSDNPFEMAYKTTNNLANKLILIGNMLLYAISRHDSAELNYHLYRASVLTALAIKQPKSVKKAVKIIAKVPIPKNENLAKIEVFINDIIEAI